MRKLFYHNRPKSYCYCRVDRLVRTYTPCEQLVPKHAYRPPTSDKINITAYCFTFAFALKKIRLCIIRRRNKIYSELLLEKSAIN
jgi:hypothetical protein